MEFATGRFVNAQSVVMCRYALYAGIAAALAGLIGCGSGGSGGSANADAPALVEASVVTPAAAPVVPLAAAASVARTLEVPDALSDIGPFDTPRSLMVPPGFGVRLMARVPGARFMARAPNGDILVSNPGTGIITLLRDTGGPVPDSHEFATGLNRPHDMVFHQIGDVTYLYISEANRVTRSVYAVGDTTTANRVVIVDDLPSASLPELQGTYSHELKNIALSPDHKLYISIASTCNACEEDTASDPLRGAIYEYNADGSGRRLFAKGLRNAEGLDFRPGTNDLWVAVNNRDQMLFPFDIDFDGDGKSDYGKLLQAFVDRYPPDLFTRVRDGGNYGWPFCNSLPNPEMNNLELARDFELNRDGSKLDCGTADRASKGVRAHSAPLGMSFLQNSNVPAAYRRGAVLAHHGCWNCSRLDAGYKVTYMPFDDAGNPGAEIDLITGFVTDPDNRILWGRPVDAIADAKGNILVSDDYSGAIYQMYPLAP